MASKNKIKKIKRNNLLNNNKFLLFLIALFGLALRLIFFSGIGTSDDLAYTRYAHNAGEGIQDSVLTLSTRIGVTYVTAFSYKLFGVNDFSSTLFVLLTSIGNIILVYYFGKLLLNEKVGLMSSFLISIFPLEVVYATKLLTDIPSAFFMALSVYFFLYAELKSHKKINYFLSGIFLGIGYLIRESALLIGLFFIIYLIYKRQIKKEYFIAAFGFVIIFAVELFILYKLTGNPFFRYTTVQDYLQQAYIHYGYFGRLNMPEGLLHYPYIILTDPLISFFYFFIIISLIYFIFNKRQNANILFFWFIPLLLYLSFGSASLTKYLPFKADPRYLSVITVPGILLLAVFLTDKKIIIGKYAKPFILALLFVSSIFFVYVRGDRNILATLKESLPYLEKLDKPIYSDSRSIKSFNYIQGYVNKLDLKEYPNEAINIKESYVIVNKRMLGDLKAVKQEVPSYIENPPSNWKIVNVIENKAGTIIVYYAK